MISVNTAQVRSAILLPSDKTQRKEKTQSWHGTLMLSFLKVSSQKKVEIYFRSRKLLQWTRE